MRQVFLSSTARDLAEFRKAACRAINGLDGFHCVCMEDFGARAEEPDDFCRQRIAGCEVAVFLVGLCHGSRPQGSPQSFTEREYLTAKEARVPRLVFLSQDGVEYSGYFKETNKRRRAQQRFRKQVSADVIRPTFTNPDQLAAAVTQAVANWAAANPERGRLGYAPINPPTPQEGGATGANGITIGGDVRGDFIANGGKKEVHYHCGECERIADQALIELASKGVEDELRPILQRRLIAPEQSRGEIRRLVDRLGDDGDLRWATLKARAELLRWAARMHASETETVGEAIRYRDRARKLEPSFDLRVVEAWILASQGDVDAALLSVRDLASPDGRSTLFTLLCKFRGDDVALAWWEEQSEKEDLSLFTGPGWHNVAVTLARVDRWHEAVNAIDAAAFHAEDCPSLVYLAGVLNAAMLLPEPYRRSALQTPPYMMIVSMVEGEESDRYRTRALESFASAERLNESLGLLKEAQQAHLMQFWLRLTDPRTAVAEEARQEIIEIARDPRQAIVLLPLIYRLRLPFDPVPARHYLESRIRLGGLSTEETVAKFMLALMTMSPGELAGFIEREELRFRPTIPRSLLTAHRIEALAEDGQYTRAKALLTERQGDFSEIETGRLQTLIDAHAGQDVRGQAEALYRQSESLDDLHGLILVLGQHQDWVALQPLLEELFRLERNLENARRLVHCLTKMPVSDDQRIVSFLEDNHDLVARSHDLASAKAWALFSLGRWQEAGSITDRLVQERSSASDILLDTNLALQSGDWERFAVIVDREWDRRETLAPDTLLRLATLAAESDITIERGVGFARLAAEKAPDDPQVLISAWALASQVGREDAADPEWLTHAAAGSTESGPVWPVDLRKIVEELIPAHRERALKAESALVRGEIPLHFAASILNQSLSNILLDLPRRNAEEKDGRRHAVIPVFSGARTTIKIDPTWIVGLDLTSLLLLFHLDILKQTLKRLHRVALAPDTMLFLLRERRQARFHQPSRIRRADTIRGLIDCRRLTVAGELPEPPEWLTAEVGRDLAQLLEAAKIGKGKVVRPLPIHKLQSLQTEQAELGEYARFVVSTLAFTRQLLDSGRIDDAAHERALGYLSLHDQDHEVEMDSGILERPLLLDDLALIFLHDAGLLSTICNADLDLQVHPSFREEQEALIDANRHGDRLAASLDQLRRLLRDALVSCKAFFLPHHQWTDADQKRNWLDTPSLGTFLSDATPCQAVCFDDRFLNRNPMLSDQKGHAVSLLSTLDILDFLVTQRCITEDEREEKLHRLRIGGFGIVPVSKRELRRRLFRAKLDKGGALLESLELRAIRQTTLRLRSLDLVQFNELQFLARLQQDCVRVLLELWRDGTNPPGRAVAMSDWLWRNVAPSPLDWGRIAQGGPGGAALPEAYGQHLTFVLNCGMVAPESHQAAFREWVENAIIAPLLPANSALLIDCLAKLKVMIREWSMGGKGRAQRALLAEHLCNLHPPSIRRLLLEDDEFGRELGLSSQALITVGDIVHTRMDRLFAAARRLLHIRTEQSVVDEDGHTFTLAIGRDVVLLTGLPGRKEPWTAASLDLMALSSQPEERVKAVEEMLHAMGPTAPDFSVLRNVAAERELSSDEATRLITENLTGVSAIQNRIRLALNDHAGLHELVPNDFGYYERYCGPQPEGELPEEYLLTRLPAYRQQLLRRDLEAGLETCLIGTLRDDLSPGVWVEEEPHELVWQSLMRCDLAANPFSLLAVLDIAMYRQEDDRFRGLADEMMGQLLSDTLSRPDGIDTYQLLPLFANLVLNVLNTLEKGPSRPPFWKRMSAWMHAGFLLQATASYRFDLASLDRWVGEQLRWSGEYAKGLDLRREPMITATAMTAKALRQEVLGRLNTLRIRHESAGRAVPQGSEVEAAVERSEKDGMLGWWSFAGPLEGHRSLIDVEGRAIPAQEANGLIGMLGGDPTGRLFTALAYLSQSFDLRGPLLDHAREVASKIRINESGECDALLGKLNEGCIIAVAHRDEKLAEALVAAALSAAPQASSAHFVRNLLQCVLYAGAAFVDDKMWTVWIEKQLFQLAASLPRGGPSKIFHDSLGELMQVLDLTRSVHCRAQALANLAAG